MKFCVQLNPQVAIDKLRESLMRTLIEQVRVADAVGFDLFSMGDHYNILGLQRLNQFPAFTRLCAETKQCVVGSTGRRACLKKKFSLQCGIRRKGDSKL